MRPTAAISALLALASPGLAAADATVASGASSARHEDGSVTTLGPISLPQIAAGTGSTARALAPAGMRLLEQAQSYFMSVTSQDVASVEMTPLTASAVGDESGDSAAYFTQSLHGVPVEGTFAVALMHDETLRYAHHRVLPVSEIDTTPRITAETAEDTAVAAMEERVTGAQLQQGATPRLVIRALVGAPRLTWKVMVSTQGPWELRAVYVDAHDGAYVAFTTASVNEVAGAVRLPVELSCGATPTLVDVPHIAWTTGNYTDDTGSFSAPTGTTSIQVRLDGPFVHLHNAVGVVAGPFAFPVGTAFNAVTLSGVPQEQADAFYFTTRVRAWLRGRLEQDGALRQWTDQGLEVNINIKDTCNAYYDGTLNFFQAGGGCLNTARSGNIVYHEFGHGIHDHASPSGSGITDGQVGEGVADFTAATILDNPNQRGLFACNDNFRTCANTFTYCASGCFAGPTTEVHQAGQVICGALWELRQQFIAMYDYDLGTVITDRFFLKFLRVVGNMDSSYAAAIAADDDDDANPANGTLHSCQINRAFADDAPGGHPHFPKLTHRVPALPSMVLEHDPPGNIAPQPGVPLTLSLRAVVDKACSGTTMETQVLLHYQVGETGPVQTAPMVAGTPVAKTGITPYEVTLADVQAPATVIYYFTAQLGTQVFVYPYQDPHQVHDASWPLYRQELRLSQGTTIFASDFEKDGGGLVASADNAAVADWTWGVVSGPTNRAHAPSGTHVWSTGLRGDGAYQRGRTSYLDVPAFDASAYVGVHLQFWRMLLSADVARIEVNGQPVFENHAGAVPWHDPTWTYEDIDISKLAAGQKDVKVRFVMSDAFDDTFQLAGFSIDNLRIEGVLPVAVNNAGGAASTTGNAAGNAAGNGIDKTTNASAVSHVFAQGCASGQGIGLPAALAALITLMGRQRRSRAVRSAP